MKPDLDAEIERWIDAAEDATRELAVAALGCSVEANATRGTEPPAQLSGAYLQLLSDRQVVQVGLCGDEAALTHLAAGLLGLDGPLSHADVTDAVGEIVNMVAGGIKRRLLPAYPGLQLGLPVFIHGHLEARGRQELRVSHLPLSTGHRLVLIVLGERRANWARSAG